MLQTSQVMNNKMHTNSSSLFLKASTKRWTKIGANLTVKVNSCFPIFCWVSDPFQIMYMWYLLFHFFFPLCPLLFFPVFFFALVAVWKSNSRINHIQFCRKICSILGR